MNPAMAVVVKRALVILLLSVVPFAAADAQLRGHGGPVRALAISPDGHEAVSGSFDTSAIRWSLARNAAEQVMRFHDAAVNAVIWLKDGRIATAGADAHIALWTPGRAAPDTVLDGHKGPIAALALSPDGTTLASASWDRTVRLWPLEGGAPRVLEGHANNVNGVAFTPDGNNVVSAGYDASLRIWPLAGGPDIVRNLPTPLNAVVVAPDGEIVTAGGDGKVYFLSPTGETRGELQAQPTPIIALALSPDGNLIAAAGIRGSVAVIDRASRKLAHTLVGPGLPVWSVAFFPDSRTLLTGGADRTIRRWNAATRRADRYGRRRRALRSARGLCRRPWRASVPRLRRLPYAQSRRRQPRGPDIGRHLRPPDRDAAGLQFLARAQTTRHRVDAGDGCETVRNRSGALHARHQDAGAAHHLAGRPQGAGGVFREGDEIGQPARPQPSPFSLRSRSRR